MTDAQIAQIDGLYGLSVEHPEYDLVVWDQDARRYRSLACIGKTKDEPPKVCFVVKDAANA